MLELGAGAAANALPPEDVSYWRDFAARLVTGTICTLPDVDAHDAPVPAPEPAELEALAAAAPPMTGAEVITASVLDSLWTATVAAFRSELAESKASVQEFLRRRSPAWNSVVGRVRFNLAENRRDEEDVRVAVPHPCGNQKRFARDSPRSSTRSRWTRIM